MDRVITTIAPKPHVEVFLNLLFKEIPTACVYGGYLRDTIAGGSTGGSTFKDIDVRIPQGSLQGFEKLLEQMDFIRKITRRRVYEICYGDTTTLELAIGGQLLQVDFTTGIASDFARRRARASPFEDWCDFTCNNLAYTKEGHLTTRCPDPSGQKTGLVWLLQCIQDARDRKLVPICPTQFMKADRIVKDWILRGHLGMVRRALKMQARGWTLCPHIEGAELKFTPSVSDQDLCPKCEDALGGHSIKLMCGCCFHADCIFLHTASKVDSDAHCPKCFDIIRTSVREPKQPKQPAISSESVTPLTGDTATATTEVLTGK